MRLRLPNQPPPRVRAFLRRPRIARLALLARRSVREHLDDHCQQLAAAISYHLLFSLFPLAIAGIGLVGLVARDASARAAIVNHVVSVIPLNSRGRDQLGELLTSVSGTSGALGLLGLVGAVYSASGVMAAVRTGVNLAWDVDQRRPFLRGKGVDLILVLASFVAVAAVLAATALTRLARAGGEHLPGWLAMFAGPVVAVVAVVFAAALLFGVFALSYRVLPAVEVPWRTVWPGALVAAVGFEILQTAFSVYVSNFAHYNRVYGSLGGVVAFLFFVYLASSVYLFGAEVCSEYGRLPDRLPRASDAIAYPTAP